MSLTVVVPDRPATQPSGGDRYDAAVVGRWREVGRPVELLSVTGGWPRPAPREEEHLAGLLRGGDGGPVLLDGLVGCSAPAVVEQTVARRPVVLLVHALLADGAGAVGEDASELDRRERRALLAADAVVTISDWAGRRILERHGVAGATVARPGTDAAPVAPGSEGTTGVPGLLSLGAVTPLKNHAVLLAALEQVADLPWTLTVAGPAPDREHLDRLRADAGARGLSTRVRWAGPLSGDALEAAWSSTDLLVHPSRSETYGMVVAEALAHGIPAVVGAGTGAEEASGGTGAAVPPDDPGELALVLRRWLSEPSLRSRWREAALARRGRLTGWDRTVERIDRVLARISS